MTFTISSEDPRSITAIAIAAGASQWLKAHTADGRKVYGVPSQSAPNVYHLVDARSCTCQDFQRRQQACTHVLAVRLHVTLARATERKGVRLAA